ncbi:uncharacterized protein LOC121731371 isoform X2 [Aricia agestis]|uniref:uncharacterized protein LOC121731371 isoform X2 n=1 Tax=Aricia agestis TaxID=91739 RepID=UPI001C203ACE|nr:uncharacterized protein LOC121731371 isoform X2 [Aricia agestis]
MYKLICVVLIAAALLQGARGKRTRKSKYAAEEAQESTPQPSVLTYSTFGFNDVGSYNGFLPTSPDYASYLDRTRDHNTRLYAPAFPSAADSGFGSNEPITAEGPNVPNFQSSMSFFTSPSADFKGKNANEGGVYGQTDDDLAYGAKLSKSKNKPLTDVNNTGINIYGSVASSIAESEASNERNPFRPHAQASSDPKLSPGETSDVPPNVFRQPYHSYEVHEYEKPTSTSNPPYKFPKVVDFTKYKQNYPTSVDNKYVDMSHKPINLDAMVNGDENSNINTYSQPATSQMYQSRYEYKDPQAENEGPKFSTFQYQNPTDNSIHVGQTKQTKTNTEYKDKVKSRPLHLQFSNDDRKKFKNMKGYEYSTNHSTTSFKFDYGSSRPNFNSSVDEISPASSNLGFTSYQLPENPYNDLAKAPSIKNYYDPESSKGLSFYREKPVVEETYEYKNPFPVQRPKLVEEATYDFKSPFTDGTVPTSSSHWGNIFKETGFSIPKTHPWKQQNTHEDIDIVHIPKKHENHKYVKQYENNPSEWSYNSYRPLKSNYRPQVDWSDNYSTRYRNEEELLGLRNHDSLQSNNLPNYKPSYNDFEDEVDYRKLVEKWRQNYIRTKHKEALREYEPYASDSKSVHVPTTKPYPVHVPVMKPYPVTIPQIKPVFHHSKSQDDDDDEDYPPRDKKPYYKKSKNHRSRPRPTPPPRRPSRMTYERSKRRPYSRPSSSSDHRRPSRDQGHRDHRDQRDHYRDRPHRYHEDFEEYDDSDYALYCKRTGKC